MPPGFSRLEGSAFGRIDCTGIFVALATCVGAVNTVGVAEMGVVEVVGTMEAVGVTKTVGVMVGKDIEVGGTNAKNGIFICP